MSNRFARFRESPSDVRAGVYPEDRKIRRTGVYKSMGFICRNQCRIERTEAVTLSINLCFGLPFENRHLLVTVMRVERNFSARREARQARRDVLGADLLGDQGVVRMPLPRSTTGSESIFKI